MKFKIIEVRKKRWVWIPLRPYITTVEFENGDIVEFETYEPDSDLYFYGLNEAIREYNGNSKTTNWKKGIRNLLTTEYNFEDQYSYQHYSKLFKTGKVFDTFDKEIPQTATSENKAITEGQ